MNTPVDQEKSTVERPIDFSRPFLPASLTPLYHTSAYHVLNPPQQLRYNQLHALYFQEQIMFFEKTLADNVLEPFLAENLPANLKRDLEEFIAEERRHSALFLQLNRRCAPELYSGNEFHFVQLPWLGKNLLRFMSRLPKVFPLFLWLALIQEERSMYFAREFLNCDEDLEPHFLSLQRMHLADEVGHVQCDQELLDWLWPRTPAWLRQLNAHLLGWMIGEYFSLPKRAGLRVLEQLAAEFPELRSSSQKLRQQLLELKNDLPYRSSLYSRENIPKTLARFDAWPEFRTLCRHIPGYLPQLLPTSP